jgi:hypothetical protein
MNVVVVVVLLVIVGAVIYYFMNKPEEGDDCEGKDENGNYVINDKGKCVLKSCKTGYYKSGEECLVDQSGDTCVPTDITPDPQGMYLTDKTGGCEFDSCKTGYKLDTAGTTCIEYVNLVTSSTGHREAARNLMIYIDDSGKLTSKPYVEGTAPVWALNKAGPDEYWLESKGKAIEVFSNERTDDGGGARAIPFVKAPNTKWKFEKSGNEMYILNSGATAHHKSGITHMLYMNDDSGVVRTWKKWVDPQTKWVMKK